MLFPFLLLVFHRSHLLIAALAAGLIATASFINTRLARALGTDGKPGQQLFDVLTGTRRARRDGRGPKHKEFEFMGAPAAPVLVNRHLLSRIVTRQDPIAPTPFSTRAVFEAMERLRLKKLLPALADRRG